MKVRTRKTLLFALLAGALGLAVIDPGDNQRAVHASSQRATDTRRAETGMDSPPLSGTGETASPLALPERQGLSEATAALFSPHSWQRALPKPSW